MKVHTKETVEKENIIKVDYSLFPAEGDGVATIQEWENGEGCDVTLEGVKIELTNCELNTIVLLQAMRFNRNML